MTDTQIPESPTPQKTENQAGAPPPPEAQFLLAGEYEHDFQLTQRGVWREKYSGIFRMKYPTMPNMAAIARRTDVILGGPAEQHSWEAYSYANAQATIEVLTVKGPSWFYKRNGNGEYQRDPISGNPVPDLETLKDPARVFAMLREYDQWRQRFLQDDQGEPEGDRPESSSP